MVDVLVIGGGFSGCCSAHVLAGRGWNVDIVERAPMLGGGLRTYWYGGHPYTFGPRHFLTENEEWFAFLNEYIPMRDLGSEHENVTYIEPDQSFYTYPPHVDDIPLMPDGEQIQKEVDALPGDMSDFNFKEHWIASIGPSLYGKFAEKYSKKMWMIDNNEELDGEEFQPVQLSYDGEVMGTCKTKIRSGPRAVWASDKVISAFPHAANGYNDYFDIATSEANPLLGCEIEEFDIEKSRVKIEGEWRTYDLIINTVSPEHILNNTFGALRWMGRDFMKLVLPVETVFPKNIFFMYFANEEPFTRIVEYKKFYRHESPTTLLGMEIPSKSNKLYPYPTKSDQAHAQKYLDALPDNVHSIGRAAIYRYIDVDDIIGQCLELKGNV